MESLVGTTQKIPFVYSYDGYEWFQGASGWDSYNRTWTGIKYGNGKFYAGNTNTNSTKQNQIAESDDGISGWTFFNSPGN